MLMNLVKLGREADAALLLDRYIANADDAALQIDEVLELCETQLTSAEVFTALFELELAGRIRSLPGKNYVRRM